MPGALSPLHMHASIRSKGGKEDVRSSNFGGLPCTGGGSLERGAVAVEGDGGRNEDQNGGQQLYCYVCQVQISVRSRASVQTRGTSLFLIQYRSFSITTDTSVLYLYHVVRKLKVCTATLYCNPFIPSTFPSSLASQCETRFAFINPLSVGPGPRCAENLMLIQCMVGLH